jgi:hypothetical protein
MFDKNHVWSDTIPRQIKQGPDTIVLRQCVSCGRDFAKGLDGADWCAVSIGALKVRRLDDAVSKQWMEEECRGRRLGDDNIARRMRAD